MTDAIQLTRDHEWLDANGKQSFAMGTLSLTATRRYHGLLCTARNERDRHVLVSTVDEMVTVGIRSFRLSAHAFANTERMESEGLSAFRTDPWPTWLCEVGEAKVRRSLFVTHASSATVLTYEHVSGPAAQFEVRPLLAMRNAHEVQSKREASDVYVDAWTGRISITARDRDVPTLTIFHDGEFDNERSVWRSFMLSKERERGLECVEDLIVPGTIRFTLSEGERMSIVFSATDDVMFDVDAAMRDEHTHRRSLSEAANAVGSSLAANAYHTVGDEPRALTAGFPWYGARTRDALLSMPGLLLSRGDIDGARALLHACADRVRSGLLPQKLDESPDGVYEVDTALHFVECVRLFVEAEGRDLYVDDHLYEKVLEIVASCASGTPTVHFDVDGLLAVMGAHPTSWMNTTVDGRPATPRDGKTVEVQALWYNALLVAADLAQTRRATVMASELRGLARRVKEQFMSLFWDDELGYCADVVASKNARMVRDMRLRPNQLFAAALCYPVLSREEAGRMLEHVHDKLLTERGVRTLASDEAGYVARLPHGETERQASMHAGAAWPWLTGLYCRALVYAHGADTVRSEVERVTLPLLDAATSEGLLGHIAECYDAESPQKPHGAPGYAPNLAEALRVKHEILDGHTPVERLSAPPVVLRPLSMTWFDDSATAARDATSSGSRARSDVQVPAKDRPTQDS